MPLFSVPECIYVSKFMQAPCESLNILITGQPGFKGIPGTSPLGPPGFTGHKGAKGKAGLQGELLFTI